MSIYEFESQQQLVWKEWYLGIQGFFYFAQGVGWGGRGAGTALAGFILGLIIEKQPYIGWNLAYLIPAFFLIKWLKQQKENNIIVNRNMKKDEEST
ncbi:MAG TPA: hypothetical protein VMX55_12040 [candidate division Zixibacteria bacterium]|nr:hypothetical protein [candidate division Zixibacteria bacterium]